MIRRTHGVRARRISALGAVTAVVYGVAGTGLLLSATFYTEGKNPRWLLATLGALAVGFVLTALLRGLAFTRLEAEVMLGVQLAAIVGLAVGSDLDLGAFSNGVALPLIGIYAAWFLRRVAVVLLYAGAAAWTVVMMLRSGSVLASVALTVGAEAIIATQVVRLLRGRIVRLTRTDSLTGVLNRRAIEAEGRRLVLHAARRDRPVSVALIDLDDLRGVNNTSGHHAGDALLVEAARQWDEELVDGAVVGRVGGDEFVMLLPGATAAEAEERLAGLRERASVSWTAGVTQLRTGESFEQVLERADQVMYNRKGVHSSARPDGGQA